MKILLYFKMTQEFIANINGPNKNKIYFPNPSKRTGYEIKFNPVNWITMIRKSSEHLRATYENTFQWGWAADEN